MESNEDHSVHNERRRLVALKLAIECWGQHGKAEEILENADKFDKFIVEGSLPPKET